MNQHLLSELAGWTVLGIKPLMRFFQKDTSHVRLIRKLEAVSRFMTSASYVLLNEWGPASVQAFGGTRILSLLTKKGLENKNKVLIATCTGSALTSIFSAYASGKAYQLMPAIGSMMGSLADMKGKARVTRANFLLVSAFVWGPTAYMANNRPLLISDATVVAIMGYTINNKDIKKASGLDRAKFSRDFPSYLYGLYHGAATGADRKAQVATEMSDLTPEEVDKLYANKSREHDNPYYLTQQQDLREIEASLGMAL